MVTSAMKRSSLVARSLRLAISSSSGVVSMKRVVTVPAAKSGWLMTFSRNWRLEATPRMRNSRSARSMRWMDSFAVGAQAVTLTSSES